MNTCFFSIFHRSTFVHSSQTGHTADALGQGISEFPDLTQESQRAQQFRVPESNRSNPELVICLIGMESEVGFIFFIFITA